MDRYELSAGILMVEEGVRAHVCVGMHVCARLLLCVCKPASKSSVMIREKSIQGGSRQTIELFEGESHFPELFRRIAKLK